jgi:methylmalonyl-CoA epimerase
MKQILNEIDHIGIAVDDLQEVIETFRKGFGLQPSFTQEITDQKVRIAGYTIGTSTVEYFEPTAPDSPVSRFLEKRKNGIHHIAFRVENLKKTLSELKEKGFQLIDEEPRPGANGSRIAFIHPSSFNGILIELCEF